MLGSLFKHDLPNELEIPKKITNLAEYEFHTILKRFCVLLHPNDCQKLIDLF